MEERERGKERRGTLYLVPRVPSRNQRGERRGDKGMKVRGRRRWEAMRGRRMIKEREGDLEGKG